MQIDEREVGDVTILDIKGRLAHGDGAGLLMEKVDRLLERGCRKVLLNLAEARDIDSHGLGAIVYTDTALSRRGGRLKSVYFSNPFPSVTKLLDLDAFHSFDNEQDAIQSFVEDAV